MQRRLAGIMVFVAFLAAVLPHSGQVLAAPPNMVAETPDDFVSMPKQEPKPLAVPLARTVVLGVYDPAGAFADSGGIGIEHVYVYWQQLDRKMLRAKIDYARARGRRMLVTVEPYTRAPDWRSGGSHLFADILSGDFDPEITAVCGEIALAGQGTIVRWGHEMEQPVARYPWARDDAEGYKSAYRHFVEQCRANAPKAQFMWSPKGESNLRDYYPGDAWVDLVGLSVYGLQGWDQKYFNRDRSFAQVFGEKYARVIRFRKPVVIAEFGVAGSDAYRQAWLNDMGRRLAKFPRLAAIVYFNAEEPSAWPAGLGSPDWRVIPTSFVQ